MQQIVGSRATVVGDPEGGAVFKHELPRAHARASKARNKTISRRRVLRRRNLRGREAAADRKHCLPCVVDAVRAVQLPIEDAERASPEAARINDPVRQDDTGVTRRSSRAGRHRVKASILETSRDGIARAKEVVDIVVSCRVDDTKYSSGGCAGASIALVRVRRCVKRTDSRDTRERA